MSESNDRFFSRDFKNIVKEMCESNDGFFNRDFKKLAKGMRKSARLDEIEFIGTIPSEDLQDDYCASVQLVRLAVSDCRETEEGLEILTNLRDHLEMIFSESEKLNPDFVRPDIESLDAVIEKMSH